MALFPTFCSIKGSGPEELDPADGGGVGEFRREFWRLFGGVITVMMLETLVLFSVSCRERLRMTSDFIESGRLFPWSFKLEREGGQSITPFAFPRVAS